MHSEMILFSDLTMLRVVYISCTLRKFIDPRYAVI